VAVCEIGFQDSAYVLIRSLYEGMLALRFVISEPIAESSQSEKLRKAIKSLPVIPVGDKGVAFRAEMYMGSRVAMMLNELNDPVVNAAVASVVPADVVDGYRKDVEELRERLGDAWVDQFGERPWTYSGLNVRHLAESRGLLEIHAKNYSLLCSSSHAHDGIHFVVSLIDETVGVKMVGDIDRLKTALQMGCAFIGQSLIDINDFYSLGFESEFSKIISQANANVKSGKVGGD
jgi:hypothetical protein